MDDLTKEDGQFIENLLTAGSQEAIGETAPEAVSGLNSVEAAATQALPALTSLNIQLDKVSKNMNTMGSGEPLNINTLMSSFTMNVDNAMASIKNGDYQNMKDMLASVSAKERKDYLKNGGQKELDEAKIYYEIDKKVSDVVESEMMSVFKEVETFNLDKNKSIGISQDILNTYGKLHDVILRSALNSILGRFNNEQLLTGSAKIDIDSFDIRSIFANDFLNQNLRIQQKAAKYAGRDNQVITDDINRYTWERSIENQDRGIISDSEVKDIVSKGKTKDMSDLLTMVDEFEKAFDDFSKLDPTIKNTESMVISLNELISLAKSIDPDDSLKLSDYFNNAKGVINQHFGSYKPASYQQETIDESAFRNEDYNFLEAKKIADENLATAKMYEKIFGNVANQNKEKVETFYKGEDGRDDLLRELKLQMGRISTYKQMMENFDNSAFETAEERRMSSKFYNGFYDKESKKEIMGYSELEEALTRFKELDEALRESKKKLGPEFEKFARGDNSSQYKTALGAQLYESAVKGIEEYESTLKQLLETTRKLNHETEEDIKNNKEKIKQTRDKFNKDFPSGEGKADYDQWKYALRRDAKQQSDFEKAMPANFSTTGNAKQSFLKTVYNKSTGYRQRQGLSGFLANYGYNQSGTALSIGLGMLGKAVTDATKNMTEFSKASLEAFGKIEAVKTNLGIVYGSQSEAESTFSEIASYSVKSPFGVQTVSEFAVLLKQSGVYASDLMTTLKQIGDVAGGNQAKFGNIANSFAQIEANGKATTRQLRQFATAGIPIYKELSEYLGVSVSEIRKMTESGKITSDIIENVFAKMTGEGGIFNNAVNIGAKTIQARKQNLSDAKELASAELGKFFVDFGQTANNDSIYKNVLSIKEALYGWIGDYFKRENLKKGLVDSGTGDQLIFKYTSKLMNAERSGNQKAIEKYTEKIEKLYDRYDPDTKRSLYAQAYDYYAEPKTFGQSVKETFRPGYTRQMMQATFMKPELESAYYQREVGTLLSAATEAIDKAMNKDPKSLFNFYSKSQSMYAQTAKGKLEEQNKQEKEYREAYNLYKKLSELIDSKGVLTKSGLDINALKQLYGSGILQPVRRINIEKPEDMANDSVFLKTKYKNEEDRKKALEQRASDWKYSYEQLNKLFDSDIGEKEKSELEKIIKSMQDANGELVDNSTKNVNKFSKVYIKAINQLKKSGFGDFADIISKSFNIFEKGGALRPWEEIQSGKSSEVDPLWRRILSSSLGLDITALRKSGISGGAAVNLYNDSAMRKEVQTITSAMLKTQSFKDIQKNIVRTDEKNNYDGTAVINYKKTSENFKNIAMSLDSLPNITKSYADSLNSEVDALSNFLSQSISMTEEGKNIYDPQYAKFLGQYAEQLKALDVNAYSAIYDESTGKFKESAIETASALLETKKSALQAASALSDMKSIVSQKRDENAKSNIVFNATLGAYGSRLEELMGSSLTREQQVELIESAFERYNSDENNKTKYKNFDNYFNQVLLAGSYANEYEKTVKEFAKVGKQIKEKFGDSGIAFWVDKGVKIPESNYTSEDYVKLRNEYNKSFDEKEEYKAKMEALNAEKEISEAYKENARLILAQRPLRDSFLTQIQDLSSTFLGESKYDFSRNGKVNPKNSWFQQKSLDYLGLGRENIETVSKQLFMELDNDTEVINSVAVKSILDLLNSQSSTNLNVNGLITKLEQAGLIGRDKQGKITNIDYEALGEEQNLKFLNEIVEVTGQLKQAAEETEKAFTTLGDTIRNTFKSQLLGAFNNTMSTLGSNIYKLDNSLITQEKATENLKSIWKGVAAEMFNAIGPATTEAGLSLISAGAKLNNWAEMAAGVGLVAAGGVMSLTGGFLSAANEDKDDDKTKAQEERLSKLRDLLKEIIDQAKIDADYYERNSRHQQALSIAGGLSVNDAIITPQGHVISTHPDDYLIATKTPQTLMGGAGSFSPNITFTVENNGEPVQIERTEKKTDRFGNIELVAVITSAVGQKIADGDMDQYFDARSQRIQGRSYSM